MIDPLRSYNPFVILDLIYDFIRNFATGGGLSDLSEYFLNLYHQYRHILLFMSLFASSTLFIFILYIIYRVRKINSKQMKSLIPVKNTKDKEKDKDLKNEKWAIIMNHIESENANDWRLAILEADIVLGELMDKLGYRGDSMGEQLKSVEKDDFITIDDAWEAHKVRNSIAHEGSGFLITEREAKRIIGLYKKVFEEHGYI